MGEIPSGVCNMCGHLVDKLNIKYIQYPHIVCRCHGPNHFDRFELCDKCINRPIPVDMISDHITLLDGDEEKRIDINPELIKVINDAIESIDNGITVETVKDYKQLEEALDPTKDYDKSQDKVYIILMELLNTNLLKAKKGEQHERTEVTIHSGNTIGSEESGTKSE